MKRKLIPIAAVLVLCGCNVKSSITSINEIRSQSPLPLIEEKKVSKNCDEYIPLNYERQKGIWLSYIDLADILSEQSAESFEMRFNEVCCDISGLGCNTIYVHVRPFGDAVYSSELYPPSIYLNGDYDPLKIICEAAHEYDLSVQAWINPLRLQSGEYLSQLSGWKTADWFNNGENTVHSVDGDDHLWLDPSYPEVRTLIADGAAEIAENYDIDGIHYDDYFYPTTDTEFDAQCFADNSGGKTLEEWRTENISLMCREIYSSVKAVDDRIEVSISPQGNIENNYEKLYADVKKWCVEDGYCDKIIPQIYYGYDDPVKPFISTLNEWTSICKDDPGRLVIGLAAYKIDNDAEFSNNVGIISEQINDCRMCQGISLYSYGSLFGENKNDERIENERLMIASALTNY